MNLPQFMAKTVCVQLSETSACPDSTLFSAFHIDRGIYIERNDSNRMWVRNWNCSDEDRNMGLDTTFTKTFISPKHIYRKVSATYKLFRYVKWRRLT
jgi:hypothetical protein